MKPNLYMNIAKAVAELSKDTTKIGAVAIDFKNRIIGCGVNGYPSGYDDKDFSNKYSKVIHAEMNCIINSTATRGGVKAIFIYGLPPCCNCLKYLAAYEVETIFYKVNRDIASVNSWVADYHENRQFHPTLFVKEIE